MIRKENLNEMKQDKIKNKSDHFEEEMTTAKRQRRKKGRGMTSLKATRREYYG